MNCPQCKSRETQVSQTRRFDSSIMRVRLCQTCLWVFKTWEEIEIDGEEEHVPGRILAEKIKAAELQAEGQKEIEVLDNGKPSEKDIEETAQDVLDAIAEEEKQKDLDNKQEAGKNEQSSTTSPSIDSTDVKSTPSQPGEDEKPQETTEEPSQVNEETTTAEEEGEGHEKADPEKDAAKRDAEKAFLEKVRKSKEKKAKPKSKPKSKSKRDAKGRGNTKSGVVGLDA